MQQPEPFQHRIEVGRDLGQQAPDHLAGHLQGAHPNGLQPA
jgi:hypothetical protein